MRDIRALAGPLAGHRPFEAAPQKHRTVQTLPDCTSTSLNLPGLSFKPIDPLDRSARSTVIQGIALLLARSWADVSECSPLSFTALFASKVRTATTCKCMAPSFMRAAAKQADQHTVKAREAYGSEDVTSDGRMPGPPQGPTPTARSPRLSCNRGASVQITSFDAAHAPSSAKHVSTVAVPHHRST